LKRRLAENFRRRYLLPKKMPFRSDGDQLEDRGGSIENKKKPPKGYSNPPGGFTSASSGNTIFSSTTPEG
jgi:hypothetical protein